MVASDYVGPNHKGVAHIAVSVGWVLLHCTYELLCETDPVVTTSNLVIECANIQKICGREDMRDLVLTVTNSCTFQYLLKHIKSLSKILVTPTCFGSQRDPSSGGHH